MKQSKSRIEAMEWWYSLSNSQKNSISLSGRSPLSLTGREIEILYQKHKIHNENLKSFINELKK